MILSQGSMGCVVCMQYAANGRCGAPGCTAYRTPSVDVWVPECPCLSCVPLNMISALCRVAAKSVEELEAVQGTLQFKHGLPMFCTPREGAPAAPSA